MSQYNDYGNNPYYGGGGGYMQGASPFSSTASPGGLRRSEASHSLRPVTIVQLARATQPHTDADWTVENTEVGQVTLVGHVTSVQIQATNRVFGLDDGTGRIEARCWADSNGEEDEEKWAGIKTDTYVRVTGGLKTFGSKKYINALHIRPIKDPHEVYYHILDTINVSLVLERGAPPGPGQQTGGPLSGRDLSAYTAQSHSNDVLSDQLASLPPLQKTIFQFIKTSATGEEGIHVAAIMRSLNIADRSVIDPAIERLLDEGHIFTTMDDSHFNVSH
ncbi:hypothetical protein AX17_003317 [Amanita inopinata Kibby_2008]|nr:hypothetical protein AX17_003317 [Amanita inopinata Kibby_2008]